MSEWVFLRAALAAVGLLIVAALVGWGVQTLVYEDKGFENVERCLVNEKRATVEPTRDPIARNAELGALRTVIETNGVTASVAQDDRAAARLVEDYRAVGGDLGARVEQRGRMVFLWDRPPSPTQRQTMFDCTY